MKIKPIEQVINVCKEVALPLGLKIFDVEFKQGKNPTLTIFIDKDGGVDLDSCELFHNAISTPLDELDFTYGLSYTLNVSSPGFDRPFKSKEDFDAHIGKMVEVKLYSSVAGKKFYEGVLISYTDSDIVIKTTQNKTISIALKNIVKVSKYIEFN